MIIPERIVFDRVTNYIYQTRTEILRKLKWQELTPISAAHGRSWFNDWLILLWDHLGKGRVQGWEFWLAEPYDSTRGDIRRSGTVTLWVSPTPFGFLKAYEDNIGLHGDLTREDYLKQLIAQVIS